MLCTRAVIEFFSDVGGLLSLPSGTCSFVLEEDGQVRAYALACHSYEEYCEHLSSTWLPAMRKKHGVDDDETLAQRAEIFVREILTCFSCALFPLVIH